MSTVDWRRCAGCQLEAPSGWPYPHGWCLKANREGVVCPDCSPSSDGHVVIMRGGKICPEEIKKLSTDQLRYFLAVQALAPHPETLEGTAELLAGARAELAARLVPRQ